MLVFMYVHAGIDRPKGRLIFGRIAYTLVMINMW